MQRRTLAILSADVAGYSRLVEAFERDTHARLRSLRETLIDPGLLHSGGEIVKRTGDGFLAIFAEPQAAVAFAVAFQDGVRRHEARVKPERALSLRVGIAYGELLLEGEDVFGQEVNVAARLQELAEPGGILVARSVQQLLQPDPAWQLVDLGPQALRNMSRPVSAFRVGRQDEKSRPRAAPVERPSIAILPFRTHQAEHSMAHVGEGIVEDIVTSLASLRQLMVISRNSTMHIDPGRLNLRTVGQDLGVRYVLSGSVRQRDHGVRVSAELADTEDATVLWAHRYDLVGRDVFDVQDQITGVIVNALAPQIQLAEVRRVLRKRPESMSGYDHFLQALSLMYRLRRDEFDRAGTLIRRAIALDDSYAPAYAYAAEWHSLRVGQGWSPDPDADTAETIRLAEASIARDGTNALGLASLGHHRSFLLRQYDDARALFDRALASSPGHARAWGLSAPTFAYIGEPEAALVRARQALRLSPHDPLGFWSRTTICIAHYVRGDYESAIESGRSALAENPRYTAAWRPLAASLAALGRKEEAGVAVERIIAIQPGVSASEHSSRSPFQSPALRELFRRHLVTAGLPD